MSARTWSGHGEGEVREAEHAAVAAQPTGAVLVDHGAHLGGVRSVRVRQQPAFPAGAPARLEAVPFAQAGHRQGEQPVAAVHGELDQVGHRTELVRPGTEAGERLCGRWVFPDRVPEQQRPARPQPRSSTRAPASGARPAISSAARASDSGALKSRYVWPDGPVSVTPATLAAGRPDHDRISGAPDGTVPGGTVAGGTVAGGTVAGGTVAGGAVPGGPAAVAIAASRGPALACAS